MSKHVRKILPLLLCLLLMACLLPAAYADGESGVVLPSEIVVPPTRSDISFRHITCDYRLKSDGVLDLYADGYTVCCFYSGDNNSFSGCNVLWYSADHKYFYQLYSGNEQLSTIFGYWGSYGNYQYSFDMDNNVIGVTYFADDGTAYNWNPPQNGESDLGWYYNDPNNNGQFVYVTLDIERNTALIPPSDFDFNGSTETFWVETPMVNTSLQGLKEAIANNEQAYTLTASAALDEELVIPEGMHVTVAETLFITSEGKLTNNGVIDLGTSGVLRIGGVFQGNPGSRIEVLDADLANIRPRVIIENGGEFKGMGGVAISKTLLEDYSSGGVDRSQIIDTPDIGAWSDAETEDAVEYFPGKDITPEIFQAMCESGRFSQIRLRGTGDLTLTANLPIPEGFILKVRNDSRLIVSEGKILGVDGEIEISEGGEIYVAGKLETKPHEGAISMYEGGVLRVTGEFKNNNYVLFGKSKLNDRVAPKLIIENGASYTAGGLRVRQNLDVNAVVQGIDMREYCRHVDHQRPENVYYPGSMLNFEGMFPVGGKYFERLEVHGLDTYTLSGSVEIPVFDDGTAATVDMSETKLVVPSGKTLHVWGELSIKDLVVENGGELLLHENGTVAVSGKLTNNGTIGMGENAQIAVSGEFVNNRLIYLRSWNGTRQLIAIEAQGKYEEHGGFDVLTQFEYERAISAIDLSDYCRLVYVTSDNNRVTRLFPGRDLSFDPNGFKQMCENGDTDYLEIRGRDTFRFESDVTIPNVMEVVANGVELVIPAGVTVTVNGKLTTRSDAKPGVSGSAQVMGVLINNGSLSLANASDLALVNGGVYSGSGSAALAGEPYAIWNDPANADIRLPAGLKTLESQALADGDFFAVYIPAGTESIADDAFGDKDMLIVYGVPGSKAQTFAGNNNYLFAPVAPAA